LRDRYRSGLERKRTRDGIAPREGGEAGQDVRPNGSGDGDPASAFLDVIDIYA